MRREITRRESFRRVGILVAAAAEGWLSLQVPCRGTDPSLEADKPGWIETSLQDRPDLISPTGGHKEYLRYAITNNELLRDGYITAVNDLFVDTKSDRPLLGDYIAKYMQYASDALKKHGKKATVDDVTHVALYLLAAVHSNFFSVGDLKRLGVTAPALCGMNDDETGWLLKAVKHVPRVFPEDVNCGVDKMMHFANHAFLVHQILYTRRHGLGDYKTIPNAMLWLNYLAGNSGDSLAFWVSTVGQYVWEAVETKDDVVDSVTQGTPIYPTNQGLFDDDVGGDYRANRYGLSFALRVTKDGLTEHDVVEAIRQLNSNRLIAYSINP